MVVLLGLDPEMDGLVVVTAPAFPVVPAVPVAEGVVCVADGVVCVAEGVVCVADGVLCVAEGVVWVTEGLPLVMAPPGAVVVALVPVCVPDVPAVPVALPVVPALPVVWADATPKAIASAKAVTSPLCIVSLNRPIEPFVWFPLLQ